MQTEYWKSTEVQPDIDTWLGFWDGCVHCACDHGCNQWVMEQTARASLIMNAMRQGKSKDRLDKLVQIPVERANKIWYYIGTRFSRKFNKLLRENDGNFQKVQEILKKDKK